MSKLKKSKEEMKKLEKCQEDLNDKKELLRQDKQNLIDKIKEDLPKYLENRLEEFSDQLKEIIDIRMLTKTSNTGYTKLEIMNLIKQPRYYLGQPPRYSSEEFYLVFEYYLKMISEANRYIKLMPTKESFCRFAGITTSTFTTYLQSDDPTRREVTQAILDYFIDTNFTLSQEREIDGVVSINRGKTTLGLIEQQAPQVVIHTDRIDLEEARKKLQNFTQSRNTSFNIELNKNHYKVEEE